MLMSDIGLIDNESLAVVRRPACIFVIQIKFLVLRTSIDMAIKINNCHGIS